MAARHGTDGRPRAAHPDKSRDALATLPALHKDPFDRILIAQALAEGLGFVTNDEPIRQFPTDTP